MQAPLVNDDLWTRRGISLLWDADELNKLCHWIQAGTLCFITWRVADSLPQQVLVELDFEVERYLRAEGIERRDALAQCLVKRDEVARSRIHWKMFLIRDKFLDGGAGRCPLRDPSHASTIKESLLHFDENRYFLTDLIVMPNHVHSIVAFASEESMLKQCAEWKRYTGRKIHAAEGRNGEFWQVDQFDHLIRGELQLEYFRRYISENPKKAGLRDGEYLHWQKDLGMRS